MILYLGMEGVQFTVVSEDLQKIALKMKMFFHRLSNWRQKLAKSVLRRSESSPFPVSMELGYYSRVLS